MTTQELLRISLQANASRTAIAGPDGTVSYRELARGADKITRYLLDKGQRGHVGICVSSRAQHITAMVGILHARCVFVPIDGSLPAARLAAMLEAVRPECIIASSRDSVRPAFEGVPVVFIEDILGDVDDAAGALDYPECDGDDSIYVYFTSGSTGVPKGIVGRNKSLLQFVQWEIGALGVEAGARFSQLISPYFDAFLRDVFVPLFSGGTICVPPAEQDFFTGSRLAAWIDAEKIGYIHCVPSVFRLINAAPKAPDVFGSLRYVLLSGEKIAPGELASWYNVFGDSIQLVNLYGATETTMIRSWYMIKPTDVRLTRIPIGFPIDGTKLVVAKEGLKPCGVMVPGDLYIVSAFVSKGYLNDPALTAARFTVVGTEAAGDVYAYKTGDKARLLADGSIDLLGREDRQIKLRGIRVEPEEIESVLHRSGLVAAAVVIHDKDMNRDGGGLVAFVIPRQENAALDAQLQSYVESWLPAHSVPAAIVSLGAFPLLPNGKIDHHSLLKARTAARERQLPVNAAEEKVLSIWKEVLGDKDFSTEDNFFTVGGSSLGMMRLIAKIYKELDIRLSLDELFNNLTIKKQAVLIGGRVKQDGYSIVPAAPKPAYELSAAQHRVYYQYEVDRSSTAFNLPMAWEIKGGVDIEAIGNACRQLVARHEILRTSFAFVDGRIKQVVANEVVFEPALLHCRVDGVRTAIADFIRPFDLEAAPLFRAAILAVEDGRRLLLTDVHHIVCDGQSQMNLLADFVRLYRGERLAPLPVQYKDYAEWEAKLRASDEYIQHREYWLRAFSGKIPQIEWPSKGGKRLSAGGGGNILFEVERSAVSPLLSLADEHNVTLSSTLFAAFLLFLARLTGQDDMVIGLNTSGRMQDELEGGVGMYAKTLPIRCRVDTALSMREYLQAVHRDLVEAQSKQLYDLADIVSELNKLRAEPVGEVIGAMYVHQRFEANGQENGAFAPYQFENKTAKYPITLFVNETPDMLVFRWEYAHSHFRDGDAQYLTGEFRRLLHELCKHVESRIEDLDARPAAETQEAIVFNF